MGGAAGGENRGAGDGNDTKAWIKARNDHVRSLRQNATRDGRAASGSASSAVRLDDPRPLVGNLANAAGIAAGAVRGAARIAQEISQGGKAAQDILDPFHTPLHPNSPAILPFYKAAAGALHAGKEIALHPAESIHRANLTLNPKASPVSPTMMSEAKRRFGIGQNQGELGFDIVAAMAAPETLAARALPMEQQVARWVSMGLTERQARYWAEPYVGMGSHYYPRGAKLPSHLGPVPLPKSLSGKRMPLPKALSDSAFNVLKPPGISRGDMYEFHVAADSHYGGGRFPEHVGRTWSRTKLGLKTHGALGRVVHGAPTALKRTVSGAAGGSVTAARREKRQ